MRQIVMTGKPAEAVAGYADRAGVNAIVVPPEYCAPRFPFRRSIAMEIAGLTARPILTLPSASNDEDTQPPLRRIACLSRGDASDNRILRLTEDLAARSGAEVIIVPEADSLARIVDPHSLLIAARPVFVCRKANGCDVLAMAEHLPCPVLSVPVLLALP